MSGMGRERGWRRMRRGRRWMWRGRSVERGMARWRRMWKGRRMKTRGSWRRGRTGRSRGRGRRRRLAVRT